LFCGFIQSIHRSLDISLDQTFGELADVVLNNDDDAVLPDFWSKKVDHERNRVTHSGVTWEWQDPSKKVLDVFMRKKEDGQKESLGIEKVTKEGEYVVALVQKDKKEGPLPVGEAISMPSGIFHVLTLFPIYRYSAGTPTISL
jgi:hypothetical protein